MLQIGITLTLIPSSGATILNVRRDALLGAMFVLVTTSVTAAQQISIRMPFGLDGFDTVTFDKTRVSVNDVKHWMKFAEWNYYGSSGISLSGCDQTATARMSKSLEQVRRVIDKLNRETDYPSELSPIVTYQALAAFQALDGRAIFSVCEDQKRARVCLPRHRRSSLSSDC